MRRMYFLLASSFCYLIYCQHTVIYAEWTQWSSWSLCANQYGTASQTRSRSCVGQTQNDCPGGTWSQARRCLGGATTYPGESYIDGPSYSTAEWRPWSEWSECTSVAGGTGVESAFRTRWRECDRSVNTSTGFFISPTYTRETLQGCDASPSSTCLPCSGLTYQQEVCGRQQTALPAPTYDYSNPPLRPPIMQVAPCDWSQWSAWSQCTASCGSNSRRYRTRRCSCATRCPDGPPIEDELCNNLPPCSGGYVRDARQYGDSFIGGGSLGLSYPCSYCPAMYPLPCYMCINLPTPSG